MWYMRGFRTQLSHIRAFVMTCRKKDELLKLLGPRTYMMDDLLPDSDGKVPPVK
jgi:hypothetical protein